MQAMMQMWVGIRTRDGVLPPETPMFAQEAFKEGHQVAPGAKSTFQLTPILASDGRIEGFGVLIMNLKEEYGTAEYSPRTMARQIDVVTDWVRGIFQEWGLGEPGVFVRATGA